jgi:predicted amidohydrolase YtcJ
VASAFALVHADVWTLAEPGAREEALLVEGGRLTRVGDERAVLRAAHQRQARVVDLKGRRVVPGLIDSHTHLIHQGLLEDRVDLAGARTRAAALTRVRRRAAAHRGPSPLIAERWDDSAWPDPRWPTRDELDAITTRFPLILRRVDGHVAVANTPALRALDGWLPGVDVGRGLLVEEASLRLNEVWPTPVPRGVRAVRATQEMALRLGVTTIHDFVVPGYLRAFQAVAAAGRLRIRVQATPYVETLDAWSQTGIETGFGGGHLRAGGVKLFADGTIGGHTAALRQPYGDEPTNQGRLNWSDAQLGGHVETAARAGLQPSIHAIGDAAIDQVLAAYARLEAGRRRRLRPRIEHFEVHDRDQVDRARDLGVVLSMQPNFVGAWSRRGHLYHQRFGDDRYRRNNEFRSIRRLGARLAFGSDCMPFDPWWGLESVVRAPHPAQRLPLEEALSAYTLGSAYGLGREDELGSLEPGKRADFLVVQGEWQRPGGLSGTHVRATVVGGRTEHGRLP